MSSHPFGILMLLQFVCVCVRERERVTIKTKCGTNSEHGTNILKHEPSIQLTQQRYVCVRLLFFCLLSAEKLLTGDEKHRKNACRLIPLVY